MGKDDAKELRTQTPKILSRAASSFILSHNNIYLFPIVTLSYLLGESIT
jgi:hypothetical protein